MAQALSPVQLVLYAAIPQLTNKIRNYISTILLRCNKKICDPLPDKEWNDPFPIARQIWISSAGKRSQSGCIPGTIPLSHDAPSRSRTPKGCCKLLKKFREAEGSAPLHMRDKYFVSDEATSGFTSRPELTNRRFADGVGEVSGGFAVASEGRRRGLFPDRPAWLRC